MADQPAFELWLEFEHVLPEPGDDPTDDLANIHVTLRDGRRYALNVWTFKFFGRAIDSNNESDHCEPEEYMLPPDLFVGRLDRPTIERVIKKMLVAGEMRDEWLCSADDGED